MQPPETCGALALAGRHLGLLRALLAAHVPGAEVLAFGSRVKGGAHEGSDLDLVVRDASDPERSVAGVDRLREALRDSALPMAVEVHDWARLPPSFRAEIEHGHRRIASA